MILKSFISFFPAILFGSIFIHLVWGRNDMWGMLLKFFLGAGIGLGIVSCMYFVRLLVFRGQSGYFIIQIALLAVSLLFLFFKPRFEQGPARSEFTYRWPGLILVAVVVMIAGYAGYTLVKQSLYFPHGDHDAYMIWNLHARFIYRGGENWRTAFSREIDPAFEPDYPLFIPLSIAGGWNFLKTETLRIPAMLAMIFTFGTAGVLFSSMGLMRTLGQASIVTIVLFSFRQFWFTGISQLADVPLAYYFLCCIVLIQIYMVERNLALIFLAGLAAGLSTWTKDEGIPFYLLALLAVLLALSLRNKNYRIFLCFLLGSLLPLGVTLYFKIMLAPHVALLVNNGLPEILAKLGDVSRYWIIVREMALVLYRLGEWQVSLILVLGIYALVMGLYLPRSEQSGFMIILFILISQLGSYFFAYLITPYNLEWHLQYSLDRLLLQLSPPLLFLVFLIINPPEKIIYGEAGNL